MVGFFTVYTYRWAFNKDFCHYVNFITNLAVYLGRMLAFSMQAISLCLILNLSKIFFWCWLLPRPFLLYLLIIRGIIKFEYFLQASRPHYLIKIHLWRWLDLFRANFHGRFLWRLRMWGQIIYVHSKQRRKNYVF